MIAKNKKSLFIVFFLWIFVSCGTDNNSRDSIAPSVAGDASIDVLVLYDREVKNAYPNITARVNHLFAVSNNVYKDSFLNITINPKAIVFYDAQTHPALNEIANSAAIKSLREEYKADTVLIYQVNPDGAFGQCGVAYGATSYSRPSHYKDAMFAQVEINCPVDTTAHELGHNMGLRHSHLQDGANPQPFPYGLGHGVNGKFATIMAYAHLYNTNNQIARFSSPEYECVAGYPCGIAIGQTGQAHATKVIAVTAPLIAKLY
jgi:hypothetical protein